MDYRYVYYSPLGDLTLGSDGSSLTGLWFENSRYFAEGLSDDNVERNDLEIFRKTDRWLDLYFAGKQPDFCPPLRMRGSAFRKRVWEILLQIPYGHTVTYADIAGQIAEERGMKKMSAQAVGGAVGHNPVSIIVPCHRVVGSNGSLTGYGGGIWRKVRLLELEGADMSGLSVPEKSRHRK